ncbi:MAG: hypothetical protein ACQKBW_06810 [Puniceicoccales bacterium]
MNTLAKALTLSTLLLGSMSAIHATVIFSEDFEEYTAGSEIAAGSGLNWLEVKPRGTGTNTMTFDAEEDTSHLFSTEYNQYGLMFANAVTVNNAVRSNVFSSGTLSGQMSFTFYDPSSATHSGDGWSLRISNASAGNGATAFGIFIKNGGLYLSYSTDVACSATPFASYDMDAANELVIVFNNQNTSMTYSGGTIVAGSMDIYLNGVLVGDDLGKAGGVPVGENIRSFNFTDKTSTAFSGTLYLDDIIVDDSISIPELSESSLFMGIIPLVLLAFRRRQNKRS